MIGMDAGWYRDPAPADPAAPTTVRYWDGTQWTTQVKPARRQDRALWRSEIAAEHLDRVAQVMAHDVGCATQPGTVLTTPLRGVTPDGERLAGWWARVGAVVIDSLVTSVVGVALGWTFVSQIVHAYSILITQMVDAAQVGSQQPTVEAFMSAIAPPLLALTAVVWAVKLVYGVGFLKVLQATPGKLVLGLEVRLRDSPGPLTWGTVLVRWFAQNVAGLLQFLPVVALAGVAYVLLDDLWPLWDGDHQALHDKVARTIVVRRRG